MPKTEYRPPSRRVSRRGAALLLASLLRVATLAAQDAPEPAVAPDLAAASAAPVDAAALPPGAAAWAEILGASADDVRALWDWSHSDGVFHATRVLYASRGGGSERDGDRQFITALLLACQDQDPQAGLAHMLASPDPYDTAFAIAVIRSLGDRRFLPELAVLRGDPRSIARWDILAPGKGTVGEFAAAVFARFAASHTGDQAPDAALPEWLEAAQARPYVLDEADIHVPPEVAVEVEVYCHRFRRAYPDYRFTITSGTRSARRQAGALLYKLRRGEDLTELYARDDLASEIMDAFAQQVDAGHATRIPAATDDQPADAPEAPEAAAVMAALTAAIQAQMERGDYISLHLRAGAVDLRCKDMTAEQQSHFLAIVKADTRFYIQQESTPPHFHLHLLDPLHAIPVDGPEAAPAPSPEPPPEP